MRLKRARNELARGHTKTSAPHYSRCAQEDRKGYLKNEPATRKVATTEAFTLIELVVVLAIFGVAMGLVTLKLGTFNYWRDEGIVRRLSETLEFLHKQAIVDQVFYRLEFKLASEKDDEPDAYSIGVIQPDEGTTSALTAITQDAGNLSLELAAFLSPAVGKSFSVVPPPSFPSLGLPVVLPVGAEFTEIRTLRGKETRGGKDPPFILFSPRGFSEFSVIHLRLSAGAEVTILVNPFTGLTQIFREYRDFQWTYKNARSGEKSS